MTERRIIGYKLVRAGLNQLPVLEREVTALVKNGWEPAGTLLQTATPEGSPVFIQQMHQFR